MFVRDIRAHGEAGDLDNPYRGDWSTFSQIESLPIVSVPCSDIEAAREVAWEACKKWHYPAAVRYTDESGQLKWLLAGWAAS